MIDNVVLQNQRDERVFAWIRAQVGDKAIASAIADLPGNRKPYVSNLCKALGLNPPADLEVTDKKAALEHLAKIRAALQGRGDFR